jgi:hypothetical protein
MMMVGFRLNFENIMTNLLPVSNSRVANNRLLVIMKMNQGQPHPLHFSNAKTVFFVNYVWNATSLFLSAIVGLKKSGVLTTGVSVVNKTCNQTSETVNKIS